MIQYHDSTRWWAIRNRGMKPETDSHMPFALLGEEGWQTMDPFLPIEVLAVYRIFTTPKDLFNILT